MSATSFSLLPGDLSVASGLGVMVSLTAVAAYCWTIVPRWPRASALTSVALAARAVAVSSALLSMVQIDWPAWPAVIALLFGHLGATAPRGRAAVALPARTSSAGPAKAPALAARWGGPSSTPAALDRTMLGRYRIDRGLWRGAMGAVYLGHDPKIGRQVAIKTMALSHEFEGAELAEARARFFREAETAGRLQHRDIVTIFDAGEDQDLAYIAMEYLKGHDLQRYTTAGQLLP